MSSYSPPSEGDGDGEFEPGVKGKEVLSKRGGLGWVAFHLDQSNYGLLLLVVVGTSIPAGLLAAGLLAYFFPEYQDVAVDVTRSITDGISDLVDDF